MSLQLKNKLLFSDTIFFGVVWVNVVRPLPHLELVFSCAKNYLSEASLPGCLALLAIEQMRCMLARRILTPPSTRPLLSEIRNNSQ